jgi:hypothetical protein
MLSTSCRLALTFSRDHAASGFGFEILHMTAPCLTRNNLPPLALEAFLELLRPFVYGPGEKLINAFGSGTYTC